MIRAAHTIVAITALAFAIPSVAAQSGFAMAGDKDGAFYIILTKEPCPAEMVKAAIKPEYQSAFRLAHERFQGREIRACWAPNPPVVMIFDEEGDTGAMPMSAFHPVDDI